MNYLLNESGCDFIVRTNVSSYWGIEKLREFLSNKPQSDYYAGCTEKLYGGLRGRIQETRYASGAGIIMSTDVAKRLVENRTKFSKCFIDDLAIGKVASSLGLKPCELNRIDVDSLEKLDALSSEDLLGSYHFRCKSYVYPGLPEPRGDVEIMRNLHMRRSTGGYSTPI
jgi:hypothetical protein